MSLIDELASCDAMRQAELIRLGELKPVEPTEAAIARAERFNPAINAIVTPLYDSARSQAASIPSEGSLAGVPFLLKDLLASLANVRMTSGSRFSRDLVPDRDSDLVTRYKRARLV